MEIDYPQPVVANKIIRPYAKFLRIPGKTQTKPGGEIFTLLIRRSLAGFPVLVRKTPLLPLVLLYTLFHRDNK